MFPNISVEKANILQQKIAEIKSTLDQDVFNFSTNNITISLSVLGNIKEILNPLNLSLEEIIPVINEATTKARQEFEIKQAQLLQKEMQNLM